MRICISLVLAVAAWAAPVARAIEEPTAGAPGPVEGPPVVPVRRSAAFSVDLDVPDRFTATQGVVASVDLWRKTILAAHSSLVVVGGGVPHTWLDPLLRLREQRPEVSVTALLDRDVLGPQGEVAEQLVSAGIKVRFSSSIASMAGWPNEPAFRSLLLVRDGESVLLISGLGSPAARDAWIQAWKIESVPVAQAYQTRVAQLASNLPPYPAAKKLLLNDQ